MSESREAILVSECPVESAPTTLTGDDRWARHDARAGRRMRLVAAIALTLGVVWASVSLG